MFNIGNAGGEDVQIQPSDWGLELLKHLSGNKAAAIPSSLHQQPVGRPAGLAPVATAEPQNQDEPPIATSQPCHQASSNNEEPGVCVSVMLCKAMSLNL